MGYLYGVIINRDDGDDATEPSDDDPVVITDPATFDSNDNTDLDTAMEKYDSLFDGFKYNVAHDPFYGKGYSNGVGNYNNHDHHIEATEVEEEDEELSKENRWGADDNNINRSGQYNNYAPPSRPPPPSRYNNNGYNNGGGQRYY